MKKIKAILAIFTLSTILGVASVNAGTPYLSFVGLKIPTLKGIVSTDVYQKDIEGTQTLYISQTVDSVGGNSRKTQAKLNGSTSSEWYDVVDRKAATWMEDFAKKTGGFYMQLRAATNSFTSYSLNGTWYLDYRLVNI